MGYIAHDAVVVVRNDYRPENLPDMDAFRESLPEEWRHLVIGPIKAVCNGYVSYAFLPDGSKEGWTDSDLGDEYRERFKALFQQAWEDGSSTDDVVGIRFGGDHSYDYDGPTVKYVWPAAGMRD